MRRRAATTTGVLLALAGAVLGVRRYRVIAFDFLETQTSPSEADGPPASGFRATQRRYPRVRDAYQEKEGSLGGLFAARDLSYPSRRIFLRVFKREQVIELWAGEPGTGRLQLVKTYQVCGLSGELGPKRRQGDGQIPEGFYRIDHFNPQSQFHLSLRVDYPNRADRLREGRGRLGGDIYIHGSCVTIGCVPIGNDGIKELYVVAVEARAAGQTTIPVHLFPTRLDAAGLAYLDGLAGKDAALREFWRGLRGGYDAFERDRVVPAVAVDEAGRYVVRGASRAGG